MTELLFILPSLLLGFFFGYMLGFSNGEDTATKIAMKKMTEHHQWVMEQIRGL